jgi:hypothetical protein
VKSINVGVLQAEVQVSVKSNTPLAWPKKAQRPDQRRAGGPHPVLPLRTVPLWRNRLNHLAHATTGTSNPRTDETRAAQAPLRSLLELSSGG